jgi:hypothetical protein
MKYIMDAYRWPGRDKEAVAQRAGWRVARHSTLSPEKIKHFVRF